MSRALKWRNWELVKDVNLVARAAKILDTQPENPEAELTAASVRIYDDPMSCGMPTGWFADEVLKLVFATGLARTALPR